MARPTETEILLKSIEREMKEQNQRLINLDDVSMKGEEKDNRRPVKSVKPTLFVTGKRASQSDYIAARGAIATEKYTKAYLKDLKKDAKDTKKKKGTDKKDKETKDKENNKRHKETMEAYDRLVDGMSAIQDTVDVDGTGRDQRELQRAVELKRREERDKKEAQEVEKKNRGWIERQVDKATEITSNYLEDHIDSFQDQFDLQFKQRRADREDEKKDSKERAEEYRTIMSDKADSELSSTERLMKKLILSNGLEIDNITKDMMDGIEVLSRKSSDREDKFQAKWGTDFRSAMKGMSEESAKIDKDDIQARDKFNKKWLEQGHDVNELVQQAAEIEQESAIFLAEIQGDGKASVEVLKEIYANNEKRNDDISRWYAYVYKFNEDSQDNTKKLLTQGEDSYVAITDQTLAITETSGDIIDVAEESLDVQTRTADTQEEALELSKEIKTDADAEKRDGFLDRKNAKALEENKAKVLQDIRDNTAKCPEDKKPALPTASTKSDSGGGFLSSLMTMGAMKFILPKILKFGPIAALMGKMGKFGGMITKFGGMIGKLSLGGMALGALGGDGLMDTMFGGMFGSDDDDVDAKKKSGAKTNTKKPKKRGMFGKAWDGIKKGGKFVKNKAFSVAPKLAKGAGGIMSSIGGFASKMGGKTMAKFAGKTAAKKIPILGALAGGGFAVDRAMDGDFLGAGGELLSGLLGATGLGIPASLGIDGWLAMRDMNKAEASKKPKANAKANAKALPKPSGSPKPKGKGIMGKVMSVAKFALPALALSSLFGSDDVKKPSAQEMLDAPLDAEDANDMASEKKLLASVSKKTIQNSINSTNATNGGSVTIQGPSGQAVTDSTLGKENTLQEILAVLKTTESRDIALEKQKDRLAKEDALRARAKSDMALAEENGEIAPTDSGKEKKSFWDKIKEKFGITSSETPGGTSPSAPLPGFKSNNAPLGKGVGALVSKYETSGQGAGTVSSGKGDHGGVSYGTYQMSTNKGVAQRFVQGGKFADDFKGLKAGSSQFSQKWKEMASGSRGQEFSDSQDQYANNKYFAPANGKIMNSTGLDVSKRSTALQAALMSTAIQHGVGGANSIWSKAVTAAGGAKASDSDIIKAVYNERGAKGRFKSSSQAVQQSVRNRFKNEKRDALAMLGNETTEGTATPTGGTQMGVGAPTVAQGTATQGGQGGQGGTQMGVGAPASAASTQATGGTQMGVGAGNYTGKDLTGLKADARKKLDTLNSKVGAKFFIVSAYRSPAYNNKVGGAKGSMHMKGQAIDIKWPHNNQQAKTDFIKKARASGFNGIGIYPGFIHVDTGKVRAWGHTGSKSSLPAWASTALGQAPSTANAMGGADGVQVPGIGGGEGVGAGGGGGSGGSTGSAMTNGTVTAIGDGSSSNSLSGKFNSAISGGAIKGLESLPFGNLLSSIAGGKGAFNKNMLNSNNLISSGLDSIRGAIPNTTGQYPGGQIPFSGKIEDDSLKFLSGFFAGK